MEAPLEVSYNAYMKRDVRVTSRTEFDKSMKSSEHTLHRAMPIQGKPILAMQTSGLLSMSPKVICHSKACPFADGMD